MFVKRNIFFFLFSCCLFLIKQGAYSQTGIAINNTGFTSDVSAMLDVASTNKGFLLPRLTTAQRDLISSPATGLVIFNSNLIALQINIGSPSVPIWSTLDPLTGWLLNGNAVSALKTLGTTTNFALPFITNNSERMRIDATGNVGIGITNPSAALHVVKNSSGTNVLTIQNTNTGGYSSVDFYSTTGTLSSTFGFANSTTGGIFSNRAYMNSYNNDFVLTRNSSEYSIFIEGASGDIGLGTNNPAAKLDINGDVKLGANGTAFNGIIKTAVAADPPVILAGLQGFFTLTVNNANLNASVIVNPRNTLTAGMIISHVYVSAANTIRVVLQNLTALAVDLVNQTWDVTVINP